MMENEENNVSKKEKFINFFKDKKNVAILI